MTEGLQKMGGLQREATDEDLALFYDMRRRERRNFLCPLKDDMDASPKNDGLSALIVLASTPTRKGHDLLNMDSEKNDYDWLLTPPSTPLFPSLDQDVPIVNLSQRRVLTRSTSVSKPARLSYPQEPSLRMQGGNPSPRRPSTASSTSSSITSSNRGRPLSPSLTSRSSPTVRSSSPCRPSTPSGRNSVPSNRLASRSSTPTLRRNNTSPSPARAGLTNGKNRGKSLSPKLGPWEPCLPGLSAEPPPNLRTTVSDRTFHRGNGSQGIRNGTTARTRGALSDTPLQQWRAISPEGSGSWSLCYANDHNSSQTSRASVVSSCDDDTEMAESAISVSTRTSSGSVSRATNVGSKSREDPSPKRCVLPAKRQMKPNGGHGDKVPILSVAARKSYERQAAQRRSPHAMFRPLLSSVPMTSFYTSRPGGMHLRSSIPLTDSSATMNGSIHVARAEALQVGLASDIGGHQRSDIVIDGSNVGASTEEELGAISVKEEVKAHGDGSELRATDENGDGLMEVVDQVPLKELDDCDERDDDSISMTDKMDETTIGCLKGEDAHRDHKSVFSIPDVLALAHSPAEHEEECINTLKENKMKVEEQRPVNSAKIQSYGGMMTYTASLHGSHREFGSFRRQSPMKALTPRSHDGSMTVEKAASCDSFASDSYGLARSLASALSNCEPMEVPVRSPMDGVDASLCDESCDDLEREMPDLMPIDGSADCSCTSNSLACLRHECPSTTTILKDDAATKDSISVATKPSTLQVEEHLFAENHDKLSKQDVLSIIGSCVSKIISSDDDAMQHAFQEEGSAMQRRRSIDAPCINSRAVLEFSEEGVNAVANKYVAETIRKDDPSQRPHTAPSPLTRSVTLHEATDTILFCSSIIHELVYKAATLAIQGEEEKASHALSSRRDFITLFGLSGAEHKASREKAPKPRNRKRQPLGDSAICERSSYVQKQRMVHRQTPAITMRQSPMDRIENAVMGNNEEIKMPKMARGVQKKKTTKQARRVQCRCSCCMM